jgi:hypothetical protein
VNPVKMVLLRKRWRCREMGLVGLGVASGFWGRLSFVLVLVLTVTSNDRWRGKGLEWWLF